MDNLINRNIKSFTDMNDRGNPRTYEVGDVEYRHSESVQIQAIVMRLYDAGAVFTVYYDDGLCMLVATNRFSAISYFEKYDDTIGPGR